MWKIMAYVTGLIIIIVSKTLWWELAGISLITIALIGKPKGNKPRRIK